MIATLLVTLFIVIKVDAVGLSVATTEGTAVGINLSPIYTWVGIPYAKPPLGPLRFKISTPPDAYPGGTFTSQASPPKDCIQEGDASTMSEDCLTLTIYAPENAAVGEKTVMVWIHGGSYVGGGSRLYNGGILAAFGDVVVVVLNYRLGALGFLVTDSLIATEGNAGNLGLLDQQLALKWVRANIANFGGNPNNICIFGESAGGGSVSYHLLSSGSVGLFHKAIIQSGPVRLYNHRYTAAQYGNDFVHLLGCQNSDATQEVACLRAITNVSRLIDTRQTQPFFIYTYLPTLGGNGYPADLYHLARSGTIASRIPILFGEVADEGSLIELTLTGLLTPTVWEAFVDGYFPFQAAQIKSLYNATFIGAAKAAGLFWGDCALLCPQFQLADVWVGEGLPVYGYYFNISAQGSDPRLRVAHAFEIVYVFGTVPQNNIDRNVSLTVIEYWSSFAKNGVPTSPNSGNFAWPPYTAATKDQIVITSNPLKTISMATMNPKCDAWGAYYDDLRCDVNRPPTYQRIGNTPSPPPTLTPSATRPTCPPSPSPLPSLSPEAAPTTTSNPVATPDDLAATPFVTLSFLLSGLLFSLR